MGGGFGHWLNRLGPSLVYRERLGVTGGYEDACSLVGGEKSFKASPSHWKLWFILGLPLGELWQNGGHWFWTWLYGRLDGITFGNNGIRSFGSWWGVFYLDLEQDGQVDASAETASWEFLWGSKMSILITLAFLATGILLTNILFKVF